MYNKVTSEDIAALQRIVGETEVFFGSAINEDYAHDELGGISRCPKFWYGCAPRKKSAPL